MIKVLTSLSTPVLQYPWRQTPCTNTGAKCPPITKCDHQMAAVLQCCSAAVLQCMARGDNGLGAAAAAVNVNFKSAIVH